MKIKALFILLLGVLVFNPILNPIMAQEAQFRKGNEAYQNKEYDKASRAYEALHENGLISVALYYNLGNAYYQQGKLGQSILNYERALKLSPNDKQVAHNLKVVSQDLKDVQVGIEKSSVIETWMGLQHMQSSKGWSWLGIVLIWLGIARHYFMVAGAISAVKEDWLFVWSSFAHPKHFAFPFCIW